MDPKDGRVVSNFIMQGLQNKDITIYGDGSQTRSLCFVDDLLEGMVRMMASDDNFVGPVNLGNPDEHTVKEIAEEILWLTKSESRLIYMPLPKDDPTKRRPDISVAKESLNWEPKISMRSGLLETINYFKKYSDVD